MPAYIPDPYWGPGSYMEDPSPVHRHEFSDANSLYAFEFDEDAMTARLNCPGDCGAFCEPASLGGALDWALGHKCDPDATRAPSAAGTEDETA